MPISDMTPLEELIDWIERVSNASRRIHLTPSKILIRAREIQKKAETGIDTIKPITMTIENVLQNKYPDKPAKLIGTIGNHFGTGANLYTVLPKGIVEDMNSGATALLIVPSDRKRINQADIGKEVEYEIVVEKIMSSEYNRAKIVKGI
jgi:hypothetical protein